MSKKLFILGGILVLVLALAFTSVYAKGETPKATKTTTTTTSAANVFAVCGCGKVFTPDSKTEYLTIEGKKYACCSHACHEQATAVAAKDAAGTAKMMEEKTAMAMEKLSPKTTATTTTEAAPK